MTEVQYNKCIVTEKGKLEITNALANGFKIKWDKFVIGSGDNSGLDKRDLTKLINEEYQGNITETSRDDNSVTFLAHIPFGIGGFDIKEAGIINEEGQLVVISDSSSGTKKEDEELELYFKVYVEDSSIIYAVIDSQTYATKSDLKKIYNEISECDEIEIDEIIGEIKRLNLLK